MRLMILFIVLMMAGGVLGYHLDGKGGDGGAHVKCVILEDKVLVEIDRCSGIECSGTEIFLSHGDDPSGPPEGISLYEESENRVSFISREFVRKDGDYIFALPVLMDGTYDLEVVLPSGFILSDGFVYPKDYDLTSDGRSVILSWENVSEEVVVFYRGPEHLDYLYVIGIFILVVLGIVFWRLREKRFNRELERITREARDEKREVRSKNLTRNLFGEEKRIVEFLMERKSCWMKDLVGGLGISKVMATRKVRSLVEKGILKKENFGRENRISLK